MVAIKYEDLLTLMVEKYPQGFKSKKENKLVIKLDDLECGDIENFQYRDQKVVINGNDLRIYFSGNSQEGRVMIVEFIEEQSYGDN